MEQVLGYVQAARQIWLKKKEENIIFEAHLPHDPPYGHELREIQSALASPPRIP